MFWKLGLASIFSFFSVTLLVAGGDQNLGLYFHLWRNQPETLHPSPVLRTENQATQVLTFSCLFVQVRLPGAAAELQFLPGAARKTPWVIPVSWSPAGECVCVCVCVGERERERERVKRQQCYFIAFSYLRTVCSCIWAILIFSNSFFDQ